MTSESLPLGERKVISLKEARVSGLKRYFTGKPCVKGHVSERTLDRHCIVCVSFKNKNYRVMNPEKVNRFGTEFRASNPEYFKRWSADHPGRMAEYHAKWKDNNPELLRKRRIIYQHKRRSLSAECLSIGLSDKLLVMQRGRCACCKIRIGKAFHLDHIHPLSKGGANKDWNIQLLCPGCNLAKHAKHPVDFMQERGFLI
jgi:hypothetical protein